MIDVYQIPGILRKRFAWLIIVPVICVALAVVYALLRTPTYTATAELLIEPQNLQIVGNDIVQRGGTDGVQRLAIDSQAYVILSNSVLDEVIDKLDLESDPFIRPTSGGLISSLLGGGKAELSPEDRRSATIDSLRKNLKVARVENAFIFNISMTHSDRFKAAEIANEAARAYLEEQRTLRSDATLRASVELQAQADSLRKRVEAAEAAVETFRAENGLISTGDRGLVVSQSLQDINTQLTQARVELEGAKANAELLEGLTASAIEAGALPANLQTSTLGSLRVQYARIAERESQAATTLGANHPQLRELRSQLANTRGLIEAELNRVRRSVEASRQRAEANVAALEAELARVSSNSVDQSKAQIRLRQLESEAESLNTVYRSFLSRAKELDEQREIDTSNSRVISAAVAPLRPTGPSGAIVVIAAAIFGVIAAAGGSVGFEILNGRLGSERELVDVTGVPLIASVSAPPRRIAGRGGADPTAAERQMAVMRIAYALRHAFEHERPAHVLVLSVDEKLEISPLVRAIAASLYDMGEDVLLARPVDGNNGRMPEAQAPEAMPPARTRLSSRRREAAIAPAPAATDAGPFTVERLDGGAGERGVDPFSATDQEFLVIDGGSATANPYLPTLLGAADAILLVSSVGGTARSDLDRTLAILKPWEDRMLGNVALAA
ncbi:MAG: exopolysaccharide polymerization/transport protein [Stappia sp.]|nr:exopolysaccharide polymerization/transport protein [Stappia sp.]